MDKKKVASESGSVESDEEKALRTFKERLDWNIGRTGTTITRKRRMGGGGVKKPEGGWNFVITPFHSVRKQKGVPVSDAYPQKPFVAMNDGSTRDLNEDEMLYLTRMKPSLKKNS